MLVDSHCHLDRLKLENHDDALDAAISEAGARGVSAMLCVCISDENRAAVLDIAQRFPQVYASVGVHPTDVTDAVVSEAALLEWAQSPKVVALGETGLDYYYTKDSAEVQQASFANHLRVGAKTGLPIIVHTRDAREDTLRLIREHGSTESAGVLHCFTENWEMAKQAIELGYYISFSGIVTFKNAVELKDVAKRVPADRILVETDSPYLAPVPYRGKPNEPKYVREVAEYVAELRGVSFDALAEQTSANFYALFNKASSA